MLRAHQERILRVCFEAQVEAGDLQTLGNEERWLVYRRMVRERLKRVIHNAIPRTLESLKEGEFPEIFGAWLDHSPPQSRFFRDVPGEFARHVRLVWETAPPKAEWLPDLLTLELSRWTRRFVLPRDPPAAGELSFEGVPVFNPTAELLHLDHAVDKEPLQEGGYAARATHICVYRNFEDHQVRVRILNPSASDMLSRWCRGEETLSESVQAASRALGFAIDKRFIESLSTMLASFIEAGLLLGSVDQ